MKRLTYKKAGVDIEKASSLKQKLGSLLKKSYGPLVLKGVGGFGSLFSFPKEKYREPVLVASSDGVGTKLKIAQLVNKHDTVGIDLVAMNVNDILCLGAGTLFFVDYIACGKLDQEVLLNLVKGINNGCIESGCSLIGGETAELPGMYREGEYDLAGFCVGAVEKKRIIGGSKIDLGDLIIGLESNGIHSNGYSLVRKVFTESELKRMSNELLKPTRIYVKPVLSILRWEKTEKRSVIKGIAHITGGAFYNKIARILPDNLSAKIRKDSWKVPKIFRLIQNRGNIEDKEMYSTFNMGVGMVLITEPKSVKNVISKLKELKLKSWVIGEIIKGKKETIII